MYIYIHIIYIYIIFQHDFKKLSKHPGIFNILVGRRTPGIKLPSWPFRIRAMLNKFARFFWINKCWQSVGVISIPHSGHDIGLLCHVAFPFQDITRFLQTPGCSVSALASFSFCARAGSTQQGVVCSLGTICRWSTREPHEGISSFEMFRAFLFVGPCKHGPAAKWQALFYESGQIKHEAQIFCYHCIAATWTENLIQSSDSSEDSSRLEMIKIY